MQCQHPRLHQSVVYTGSIKKVSEQMKNHLDLCCKGKDKFFGFNPKYSELVLKTERSVAGSISNLANKIQKKSSPKKNS